MRPTTSSSTLKRREGFRYGGANQPVPLGTTGIAGQCTTDLANYGYTSAPLTFGPDSLWSYSVGEKATLAQGRLTLNTDAYWIEWSDVQTRLALNCSYFFTANKGSIRSRGIELESVFRVTPEISFSGNASYNDARAEGDIPTVGAFNGDRSPYFPRYIASISAFYDRNLFSGTLHAQASYSYRGDEQTTFNPEATTISNGVLIATGPSSTFAVIPASNNVDASIAYAFGHYELGDVREESHRRRQGDQHWPRHLLSDLSGGKPGDLCPAPHCRRSSECEVLVQPCAASRSSSRRSA